jgi:nucleotide-binding universal stress UspA family protein
MHSFNFSVEEILATSEREIRARLETAQEELAGAGISSEVHIRHWLPADTLLEQADAVDATLIVVGQHGSRTRRMLIGSTSGAVSREARIPVVVVRGEERESPPRRILVGADGSAGGRSALVSASTLFPAARVLLVHVSGRSRVRVEVDLGELAAAAAIEPGRLVRRGVAGDPAASLLELAASGEVDLLCAGRLGTGPLRDLLLGSVSEKLLQLAPCPLLLGH